MNKIIKVISLIVGGCASLVLTSHLFASSVLKVGGVFWESNKYILYPELIMGCLSVYVLGVMSLEVINEI